MQGMRFLIVNEQGPVAHGIITKEITPEKYLCTFLRNPQSSRVCDIAEIQGWNLFPNEAAMNAFISAVQKQAAPASPPASPPTPKKKTSKKRVTKKKASAK